EESGSVCPTCGEPLAPGVRTCPVCSLLKAPERESLLGAAGVPTEDGETEVWEARLARLRGWVEAGPLLGVTIPDFPAWAEDIARESFKDPGDRTRWQAALREVEAAASERLLASVEVGFHRIEERIQNLNAYSVDTGLESDGVREAITALPRGDPDELLAAYKRLDRVVSLKERHLEQARSDFAEVTELLRTTHALGITAQTDPEEIQKEFEAELRKGKLVPLKQWLRRIRSEAQAAAQSAGPEKVRLIGRSIADAKGRGEEISSDAGSLARAARAFATGDTEVAVRALAEITPARRTTMAASGNGALPVDRRRG
ncbi:MAG: zinc ribbon domain-containing protein, partial [Thermoplasmata archaeon]